MKNCKLLIFTCQDCPHNNLQLGHTDQIFFDGFSRKESLYGTLTCLKKCTFYYEGESQANICDVDHDPNIIAIAIAISITTFIATMAVSITFSRCKKTVLRKDDYFSLFTESVQSLRGITDIAKSVLIQKWFPSNKVKALRNLSDQHVLGSGFYGTVYQAAIKTREISSTEKINLDVAIKVRDRSLCCKDKRACNALEDDLKEASFIASCDHQFIIQLLG